MAEFTDPASRILALVDRVQPRFRARFEEVVRQIRSQSTLSRIGDLIEAGRAEEALFALEAAALRLGNVWGEVFVLAGDDTSRFISNALRATINLDRVNDRALGAMQSNQLRLVREFSAGQRAATREALLDSIERGLNPREAARAFRQSIGLTARQVRAVGNFRRLLEENSAASLSRKLRDRRFDRTIQAALESGEPLTERQIARMVQRYEERMLAFRSETIARTESLRSANAGRKEMFDQAIENGDLDAGEVVEQWVTALDERVRTSHSPMHGQQRPPGVPFTSGLGNSIPFPGGSGIAGEDIQCRCAVTTRFTDSAKQRTEEALAGIAG